MVDFTDLLSDVGIPADDTKLLRHDWRGAAALRRGIDWFGSFISYQSAANSPFATGARFGAHFIGGPRLPNGSSTAIFIGVTEVLGSWPWDNHRPPRLWLPTDVVADPSREEAVDQEWLTTDLESRGELLVDWGFAPRAWHQWARDNRKPMLLASEGHATLAQTLAAAPLVRVLSETERQQEMLRIEDQQIAADILRSPEVLNRCYEESRREARPMQDVFRRILVSKYGTICAISNCNVDAALEAAHIIPFAEGRASRNLLSNGLLLRRDIHRLFDLLMIAIDPEGQRIWLHPSLRDSQYRDLHGQEVETFASLSALAEHFRRCKQASSGPV